MLGVVVLGLVVLVALAGWWYDPASVASRMAAADRKIEAERKWAEVDTAVAKAAVVTGALIVLSGGVGTVGAVALALYAGWRRVNVWHPDSQGVVPLTDAQRDAHGVNLVLAAQQVEATRPTLGRPPKPRGLLPW
jgi:hypothetical protein